VSDLPVEQALAYRPGNILVSQVAQITRLDGVIALQQVVADE
jgi:hypothetical protein